MGDNDFKSDVLFAGVLVAIGGIGLWILGKGISKGLKDFKLFPEVKMPEIKLPTVKLPELIKEPIKLLGEGMVKSWEAITGTKVLDFEPVENIIEILKDPIKSVSEGTKEYREWYDKNIKPKISTPEAEEYRVKTEEWVERMWTP